MNKKFAALIARSRLAFASTLTALGITAGAVMEAPPAIAQEPASLTLTLPGGGTGTNVATYSFTNSVGRSGSYTAFRILHRLVNLNSAIPTNSALTVDFKRVHATKTNTISSASVAASASSSISAETNAIWFFRGDTLLLYTTITNAGSVELPIEER